MEVTDSSHPDPSHTVSGDAVTRGDASGDQRRSADSQPPSSEPSPQPPSSDPQEEPAPDPEDWSGELAALDLQLRRLGWDRQQEGIYLQRAFSHPSRIRLTRYGDLLSYLNALEAMDAGDRKSTRLNSSHRT